LEFSAQPGRIINHAIERRKRGTTRRFLRHFFQCLLWFEYVALVHPATSKETVAHHLLAKQENDGYQED
jgi:hypothetical protein